MDGSGQRRHVRQPNKSARPRLLLHGQSMVVRFDGADDHLRAVKQAGELKDFTVFLTLVPRYNIGGFQGFFALNKAPATRAVLGALRAAQPWRGARGQSLPR